YRVRDVLHHPGAERDSLYVSDSVERGQSVLNLADVVGLELTYFFYYPSEEGFGGHKHDVESTEIKLVVWQRDKCADCPYT
ncbi:MAG: hypothetical protein GWN29_05595, partial [Gammaproteobacteria bacterium]|nr:hypothetical protein [Gammaproteobacteria bacterium]